MMGRILRAIVKGEKEEMKRGDEGCEKEGKRTEKSMNCWSGDEAELKGCYVVHTTTPR